jgi:hypothetical protein
MRQFIMTLTALAVFGAAVVTAQAETPSPGEVSHGPPGYSEWATGADYQQLFNAMEKQHRYPRVVEARVFNGRVLYHAVFEPYPADCPGPALQCVWSNHGITADAFARRNDLLRRYGFRLVHKQSVHLGREFVQATWVRAMSAPVLESGGEFPCSRERSLMSVTHDQHIDVTFWNHSGEFAKAYWLNYYGKRVFYSVLAARPWTVHTYISHPWVITDANDRCEKIILPGTSQYSVYIR